LKPFQVSAAIALDAIPPRLLEELFIKFHIPFVLSLVVSYCWKASGREGRLTNLLDVIHGSTGSIVQRRFHDTEDRLLVIDI
jgi:hypothetical protein